MNPDRLNSIQSEIVLAPADTKVFLRGPAGSGKTTTAVQRLRALVDLGVPGDTILVLIPQRSLARDYLALVMDHSFPPGGEPTIITIGGLAQRMVTLFWPIVSSKVGFQNPNKPPQYLTLETAQYYLASIVEPLLQKGYFESVTIDPNRLYSQILDNLNKSAVVGFSPDEIAERLVQAWAGKPSQAIVYHQAQECALAFRDFCLKENLLDFSLQISVFAQHLWPSLLCRQYLARTYRHLIYDNAEEDYPVAHDILSEWLPNFESALVIQDDEAGYRSFMGADPVSALRLSGACSSQKVLTDSFTKTPTLNLLETCLSQSLTDHKIIGSVDPAISDAFSIHSFRFYPQVMDWISAEIDSLLQSGTVAPQEICILTPFLSDSLRFSFSNRFQNLGLPLTTFRPSRGLRDEPAIQAMLTLAKIACPTWKIKPSRDEVRACLMQIIPGCDYIRADLLTQVLYGLSTGRFRSFDDPILPEMRQRITFQVGERFEILRKWLESNSLHSDEELDIFLGRMFGEVLSQDGFEYHRDFEAASAANRLVESARKFRLAMQHNSRPSSSPINEEYILLVERGILSAQYLEDWTLQERSGSVLLSPAFSYLMSNRICRYQFWVDIGSQGWWARLDQPLTHPHVLNRNWESGTLWTDAQNFAANQTTLSRVTSGLIRRCSGHIYMCSLGLNEQGNEERGALVMAIQTILRKLKVEPGMNHV